MAVLSSLQQDASLVSCYCLFKGTVSAYRVMCSLLEHSVMAVLSSLQQDDSLVAAIATHHQVHPAYFYSKKTGKNFIS